LANIFGAKKSHLKALKKNGGCKCAAALLFSFFTMAWQPAYTAKR